MADLGAPEFRQAPKWSKHESADGVRVNSGPFVGIVKANNDPTYSGKLQVYITELGGDPTDDKSWRTVSYSTPFYGVTNHRDGGDYTGSPHSYGMWFVPPDIGVKVLCTFVNGDPLRGYWFACIPEFPYAHMVPGLSAPVDGSSPAPAVDFYGDTSDPTVFATPNKLKKLPHDAQQKIWDKQGLLKDPDRGPGTSSSMRETPSSVFGISTPGKPLDASDPQPYPDPDNPGGTAYGVKGRKGGHTFVMDDGDSQGNNQMMRLRTSAGHMIMMNDSKDFIYVINSKGTAWVEISSQGDINVYSGSAVNVSSQSGISLETKGDIKLHAGDSSKGTGDIHIKAESNINLDAKNINILASGTAKVTGKMGLHLKGKNTYLTGDMCVQVKSDGHIDLKGSCTTINTADATKAMDATPAQTPSSMPAKEPWTGHKAAANPAAQPTFGSTQGLPSGSAGKYGATSNYGSGTNIQQYYGPMTNNIPPTTYNSGPQGSFAGQSSTAAQYIPSYYIDSGQSYTIQSVIQNVSYGSGAAFDVSNLGISGSQTSGYSIGELQNNPGNLQYSTGDRYAIGFSNNLAVYAKPEDGIAALSILFDSYVGTQYLTSVQYCQKYLQAAAITDNNVISMARYIQNLTGINSNSFVTLTDPTTRIAWISAVIGFVQGRVIYTYNQVVAGCAQSLGISTTTFAQAAQSRTTPWQNNNGISPTNNFVNLSPNSGFINPASSSSGILSGNSPLTQIANRVINNVINNVVGAVSYEVGTAIGRTVSGVSGTNNSTGVNLGLAAGGQAYTSYLGQSVGSGQCVALVQAASNVGQTSTWVTGTSVTSGSLQPGTVIATFGSDGQYQNIPGQSHAAIFLGYQKDASGNITGIQVQDQWSGHACGVRTIAFGQGTAESGENFKVVTNDGSTPVTVNGAPQTITQDQVNTLQGTAATAAETVSIDTVDKVSTNTSDSRNLTNTPLNNGGGSGSSFIGTPPTNTNSVNTPPGQSYYDPRTGQVVTVAQSGDGSVVQTTEPAGPTPSALQQVQTNYSPTSYTSQTLNGAGVSDVQYTSQTLNATGVSDVQYTSQTVTSLQQNDTNINGNYVPLPPTNPSTISANSPTSAQNEYNYNPTLYTSQTLNAVEDRGSIDYTSQQPIQTGPGTTGYNASSSQNTSDFPPFGSAQPTSELNSYNYNGSDNPPPPTDNSYLYTPKDTTVTGQQNPPGTGSATSGGGQSTPQGAAATGQGAASC